MQDRHTTHTHSHRLEWRHPVGPLGIHNECAKDPQREQPGTLNHNLEESHLLKNTLISTRMRKRLLLILCFRSVMAVSLANSPKIFSKCLFSCPSTPPFCDVEGKLTDQNNLELKLPSGSSPPCYAKQRTLTRRKKKMDIKVDYTQLPAGPAPGRAPEFLAPAV